MDTFVADRHLSSPESDQTRMSLWPHRRHSCHTSHHAPWGAAAVDRPDSAFGRL